ncbi:hypothetical protein ANN_14311 [Periplaneta americana]|uniref:Reverse transcriptase domain-containing protein n=1 Tax=Periplaneta americana TaxID=6978 RepID=A0ABQ8SVZ1_PERAM|nr:hypothetical protein ANN_14311 [Periplaneta americana]
MVLKHIRKRKRNWLGHWLRRDCLLKDALEGMVNGKKYQMIDDIKIYGSYDETKRKAENRKDWRKLGLQDMEKSSQSEGDEYTTTMKEPVKTAGRFRTALPQTTKKGYIIDPTIRIETGSSQPEDVNKEKINIYLPAVDYFKAKYQLEDIELQSQSEPATNLSQRQNHRSLNHTSSQSHPFILRRNDINSSYPFGLLRTIGERYLEKNKEVFVVFVDLEKAFDRVD